MKLACVALSVLGFVVAQSDFLKVVRDDVGVMHFHKKTEKTQEQEHEDLSPRHLMSGNVFTNSDKMQILSAHNTDRADTALGKAGTQPMATDMTQMIWSSDLAATAASYAAQCEWGHSSSSYGENLYVSFSDDPAMENIGTILSGIDDWFKEYQYYTYSSRSCASGKACGHYTQVVWAKSVKVGCGYAICDPQAMMQLDYEYAVYLVCNYDPPGNYNGQYPYTKATSASSVATSCPSGYYSNQAVGLCMRSDGSNGIDTSPGLTTTQGATTTQTGTTTTRAGTTTTKAGTTTTKLGTTTTTRAATTTTATSGSCTTCSVKWRVSYATSSWSSTAQTVWSNALSTVKSQTKSGYGISGSYSTTYFDISVTTYSNTDAVTLLNYVSGSTYKSQLSTQLGSLVTSGSLVITTQPITSSSGTQAYSGEESESDSGSSSNKWWVWMVALLIGLVLGVAIGWGAYTYWKNKEKEQSQIHSRTVDFVA